MLGIERGLTEGGDTPTAARGGAARGSADSGISFGLGWGTPGGGGDRETSLNIPSSQPLAVSSLTNGPIAPTGLDADAFFEDMLKSGNMFSPTAVLAKIKPTSPRGSTSAAHGDYDRYEPIV